MRKVKTSAIIIFIIAIAFGLFGGWQLPYLVLYMVAGGFLISYLWCGFTAKRVLVYQRVDNKEYFVGDTLEIQSFIDNDTLLPIPHIEVVDRTADVITGSESKVTVSSLLPTEREIINRNFTAKYRGAHDLGPVEIEVSDVFGIVRFKRKVFSDVFVKVYPRVFDLDYFNLKSMQAYGTVTTKQKTYEDNTSVSDIRKYYPGDSMKRVHWKISAKKRNLFVKNYEMTGSASTSIFIDFKKNCFKGKNQRDLEEKAVEAACSIIAYMLKNSVSIDMYVNSSDMYYCKGRDTKEIKKFLDILCDIKADGGKTMKDVLEKRIKLISKGSSIILVTGDIQEEDTDIYYAIKQMGYDVIVVYVGDYALKDEIRAVMDGYNIRLYSLDSNSDIKGVLETV